MQFKYANQMPDRKSSFEYFKEEAKKIDEKMKNVSLNDLTFNNFS